MIPYDDLVVALASWRARQGLPTGQLAGDAVPAAAPQPAAPAPAPARAAPAMRPPAAMVMDPTHEDSLDVDESALLEEASFESDFATAFDQLNDGESTAIGAAPTPRADADGGDGRSRPPPPRRGGR